MPLPCSRVKPGGRRGEGDGRSLPEEPLTEAGHGLDLPLEPFGVRAAGIQEQFNGSARAVIVLHRHQLAPLGRFFPVHMPGIIPVQEAFQAAMVEDFPPATGALFLALILRTLVRRRKLTAQGGIDQDPLSPSRPLPPGEETEGEAGLNRKGGQAMEAPTRELHIQPDPAGRARGDRVAGLPVEADAGLGPPSPVADLDIDRRHRPREQFPARHLPASKHRSEKMDRIPDTMKSASIRAAIMYSALLPVLAAAAETTAARKM